MNDPDRSTYLGSSDIAGILGVSKWTTPLDIYRRKVFPDSLRYDEREKEKIFRRGRLLEPVIRTMAVEDHGLILLGHNNRYHDPEFDFMRAEIDFDTVDDESGQTINNDCKSVSPFAADQWGEAFTDEIPIEYHAQFQYGMMVTGRQRCDVWALFGTDDLVKYVVHRDEETIAGIREKCLTFWHDHVLALRAPAPVTLDDVEFLMRRIQGRKVVADPDTQAIVAAYADAKALAKLSEAKAEELKFQIARALLEGAERQYGKPLEDEEDAALVDEAGKPIVTWKTQTTSRLDVEMIRKVHPDVAANCSNTTTGRVMRLARRKSK